MDYSCIPKTFKRLFKTFFNGVKTTLHFIESFCVVVLLSFSSSSPNREKLPSLNDEDSRSSVGVNTCPVALTTSSVTSVVAPTTSLPGNGVAGASSPPYVVTPVDHDYIKRKSLQQRHRQRQELQQPQQQQDGTVQGPEYNSLTHSCTGEWGWWRLFTTMKLNYGLWCTIRSPPTPPLTICTRP